MTPQVVTPSAATTTTPLPNAGRSSVKSASSVPGSKSRTMGNTPSSATPGKLRRKVSVEDSLDNVVSVQRLVEYFVVISCHPRWESSSGQNDVGTSTPEVKRPQAKKECSTPVISEQQTTLRAPFPESRKKLNKSFNNVFRRREKTGTELAITASLSQEQEPETRDETVPPPKPRGTWKREDQNGTEGNIHIPESSDDYTFQPKITARYPLTDHHDNPLNPMVTQFCYPVGDVVVPTKEYSMPRVHHFVLTNDKGRKLYGTCLTFYEEYVPPPDAPFRTQDLVHSESGESDIEVTMDDKGSTLYLPRCLCILSIWPYVTAFREYLSQLYRLATSTNCMNAPIERYIMNICMEIPAPPPGAFEVQINILDSIIRFWSPPAKLPIAYVALPYKTLFDCLDIENVLHLWYCLTMERKVLLVSSQYSILTVCSEILCSLLYPMKWSHLYVPLLPRFLCPMLDAPVPYLCGVTRDNWLHVQQFVSQETIVVDLDRNSVMFGENTPELPPLPGKKWIKLQDNLEDTAGHLFWRTRGLESEYREFTHNKLNSWGFKRIARQKGETRWNENLVTFDQAFNLQFTPDSDSLEGHGAVEKEQNQWDRLQEAFLRFFVALLKDYRRFLRTPDADTPASPPPGSREWLQWSKRRYFDREAFLASQKAEYLPYLSLLTTTQQFDDFITKRLYSPEMPDIIFFDQSIDAKLNRSRLKLKKVDTPFLQSAKTHKVLKSFVAVEPSSVDLRDKGPYVYGTWPETFDPSLFCKPRPIPKIISSEFDRQAALIHRLRSNQSPGPSEENSLLGFYGSDYDNSPEGMSFTIFFFAYSAIIGREWQDYQRKRRELEAASPSPERNFGHTEQRDVIEEQPVSESLVPRQTLLTPSNAVREISFGFCDACPDGGMGLSEAAACATSSPCPQNIDEFNSQAQVAYATISQFTNSPFESMQNGRATSLLDDDDDLAEYEEARDVAVAQLDLAFDALKSMESRGLLSDPDIFKSLMEACGRCGDTKRALELTEMMKRDGLAADQEVLSCFVAAFAHDGDTPGSPSIDGDFIQGRRRSDAYSTFLKKKVERMARDSTSGTMKTGPLSDSEAESSVSDVLSTSGSEISAMATPMKQPLGTTLMDWFTPHKTVKKTQRRKRRRKKRSASKAKNEFSDRLMKQIVLGESLLEFLYPDLKIDTSSDSCPQCSRTMSEPDIITGWQPCNFQDFTTKCQSCQHRFVPRFTVSCSSATFEGSQGPGTPLHCEFLSPWVLRKELDHVISGDGGIDNFLNPDWRSGTDVRATIWWSMVAMFRRYQLPVSFLLQGSFQNRLINPVPQD